ncbi:hypothetical protein BD289DRAFT_366897 [Coniella lustricola]|uniref:Uncharacterized protein n=1 Tax=Coniella lustricola TaxID=2025994 RepID=A0A2T3AAA9_9PEZI|nr:hypothetical protein BD289DRAFT_366897 [Coniella lustricola]
MGELSNMLRVTLRGSREANPTNFSADASSITTSSLPRGTESVVLITGAAGDLGRVTATVLARFARPARIYIADLTPPPPPPSSSSSSSSPSDAVVIANDNDDATTPPPLATQQQRTSLHFLPLDLSSFASIRQCATSFLGRESSLDLLVLNAGIMRVKPCMTSEGYEGHFGINYLGHALLAKLLLPVMLRTAAAQVPQQADEGVESISQSTTTTTKPRVVVVSSEGWAMAPKGGILFDKVKTNCASMTYTARYGQSKLALIHLTKHLATAHPQLDIIAIHPGRVNTGLGTALSKESLLVRLCAPLAPFISVDPEIGARNHLWAATSRNVVSGTYYEPVGVPDKEGPSARDEAMRERLWKWTEDELKGAVEAVETQT